MMAALSLIYLTAPNVSPRTSCRWVNHPRTMIGAIASVDAADSFAQNRPSGLEYDAMKTVSGAASNVERLRVQNASFHARMKLRSSVEARPGMAIGVST